MTSCPFCQSTLEEKMAICPSCKASKAYLKVNNFKLGKNGVIFFGFIVPLMIILFAISAQNLFGVWVSLFMTLPMLFAIGRLILGPRWLQ